MCLSILFTFGLKNELKWVFSRDWPLTWTHNNLSWITDHAYGFQWFQGKILQGNDATGSFPSGHTAIAFASLLPVGLIYRRLLLWSVILATMEGCAMIIMDYHFLSDVLAGALAGVTCTLLMQAMVLSEKPARMEGAAL
jgi:membrane-associated phospholipid phosphatase